MKLSMRLTLAMVGVVLVTAAGVGTLSYRTLAKSLLSLQLDRLPASAATVATSSLLGIVVAMVVAVALALALARSLTRPLGEIAGAAEALARGKPATVTTAGRGEIGVLARAFERMSAEVTARQQAEERFRLAVEASPCGMVMVDAHGTVLLVNAETERMFGYRREELVGQSVDELVPLEARKTHSAERHRFAAAPSTRPVGVGRELRGLHRDGTEFPVEIGLNPIPSADGLLVLAVVVDITARKAAEAEQTRLREQLVQAQKMEAIGTLAGGVAHEFNNVLTVIGGNASLALADRPADDPVREALSEIERAVARGADVVRQIRAFSRLEESTLREIVEVQEVVEEAARFLRATLPVGFEIVTACDADLPAIRANRNQLHQILMNLATNAAHAMAEGGGKLEILTQAVSLDASAADLSADLRPGRYVRLTVRDNGRGMDSKTLERVFEPFFTTKGPGKGTGLGLSVVLGIVKSHRGAITAYSEPDQGTVFHLYFPASSATVEASRREAVTAPADRGGRILFVDDEVALVNLYSRILRRLGYEASAFHRPAEAIAAFRADPDGFDLVITDLAMPQIDGSKLVQQVLEIRPGTPILMATGYLDEADLERARQLGVREMIHKPYSMEDLAEALRRVMPETSRQA